MLRLTFARKPTANPALPCFREIQILPEFALTIGPFPWT